MATGARADDLGVIDRSGCYRRPGSREFFMTKLASIGGVDVRGAFTRRADTVMTGNTVVNKRRMVNGCRNPLRGTVAKIAFFSGRNMGWWFSAGDHIIVTARTYTQHFRVIDRAVGNRRPGCRPNRMTRVAGIGGINVVWIFAGRHRTIVTTDTGSQYMRVVNIRNSNRCP